MKLHRLSKTDVFRIGLGCSPGGTYAAKGIERNGYNRLVGLGYLKQGATDQWGGTYYRATRVGRLRLLDPEKLRALPAPRKKARKR